MSLAHYHNKLSLSLALPVNMKNHTPISHTYIKSIIILRIITKLINVPCYYWLRKSPLCCVLTDVSQFPTHSPMQLAKEGVCFQGDWVTVSTKCRYVKFNSWKSELNVQISCSSFFASSFIRTTASAAAALLGTNVRTLGFSCWFSSGMTLSLQSHCNSRGYRCCSFRSRFPFLVLSCTARMWPSGPGKSCWTIAKGHVPRFLSSVRTITASPVLMWYFAVLWMRLWRSLKAIRYCHRLYRLFWQVIRYFARLRWFSSSILHGSSSGNWSLR